MAASSTSGASDGGLGGKVYHPQGVAAPLIRANIDTGAIIAPIYMLSRSIDLGQKLFANWRYD